jgi:hypothetical protein
MAAGLLPVLSITYCSAMANAPPTGTPGTICMCDRFVGNKSAVVALANVSALFVVINLVTGGTMIPIAILTPNLSFTLSVPVYVPDVSTVATASQVTKQETGYGKGLAKEKLVTTVSPRAPGVTRFIPLDDPKVAILAYDLLSCKPDGVFASKFGLLLISTSSGDALFPFPVIAPVVTAAFSKPPIPHVTPPAGSILTRIAFPDNPVPKTDSPSVVHEAVNGGAVTYRPFARHSSMLLPAGEMVKVTGVDVPFPARQPEVTRSGGAG